MKMMKLVLAAAMAFGTMSVAAAPASAQGRHSGEYRHDGQRHDAGRDDNDRNRRDWRGGRGDRRDWGQARGRHYGWRNGRGRHRGWNNRRVCRTVWHRGHRERICRNVRYRR